MSVRIRLRRVGRKKQPTYRVVIAARRAARDGAYIESIGSYNPRLEPAQLRLDLERVDYWLGQGAEPSTTVHSLILKARKGGDAKVALVTAESAAAAAAPIAEPASSEPPEAEGLIVEVEPEPTPPDPEEAKAKRKSKSAGRAKTAKAEAVVEEPEAPAAEAEEQE